MVRSQDKAMIGRWGLEGMQSFEQSSVAQKEGDRLERAHKERGTDAVAA
jgi:biotin synthase